MTPRQFGRHFSAAETKRALREIEPLEHSAALEMTGVSFQPCAGIMMAGTSAHVSAETRIQSEY